MTRKITVPLSAIAKRLGLNLWPRAPHELGSSSKVPARPFLPAHVKRDVDADILILVDHAR